MAAAPPLIGKLGKVSGTLAEVGRFSERGAELQYAFIKLEQDGGGISKVERVAMPADLNRLLEIGKPMSLFLARRGLWNYCYGVDNGTQSGQSYRGYRLYFIFNRLMFYINLIFGVLLVSTPGLHVAGVGLLAFALLFALLGPASPRRMQALFAESRGVVKAEESGAN